MRYCARYVLPKRRGDDTGKGYVWSYCFHDVFQLCLVRYIETGAIVTEAMIDSKLNAILMVSQYDPIQIAILISSLNSLKHQKMYKHII